MPISSFQQSVLYLFCTYRYHKVVKTIRYNIMKWQSNYQIMYLCNLNSMLDWLNFATITSRLLLLFLKTLLLLCWKSERKNKQRTLQKYEQKFGPKRSWSQLRSIHFWHSVFSVYENKVLQLMSATLAWKVLVKRTLFS